MEIISQVLSGDFSSAYAFINDRMASLLDALLKSDTFGEFLQWFCVLGSLVAIVYFSLDLMDQFATDNFSMETLYKQLIKLIVCMLLMNNLKSILLGLSDFASAISAEMIQAIASMNTSEMDEAQFGILTKTIGYANDSKFLARDLVFKINKIPMIVNTLVGIASLISLQLLCYYLSMKRTISILWQVVLSPIAIADFCRNNSTSKGIKTIKRILSLFLEAPLSVAICLVIDAVTASPDSLNVLAAIVGIKLMWQYLLNLSSYTERIMGTGTHGIKH